MRIQQKQRKRGCQFTESGIMGGLSEGNGEGQGGRKGWKHNLVAEGLSDLVTSLKRLKLGTQKIASLTSLMTWLQFLAPV